MPGKSISPASRFALYFVPERHDALAEFGARWLGRCIWVGRARRQFAISGVADERFRMLTRTPRMYGFHATLKAPFRLAPGWTPAMVAAAAAEFAQSRPPIPHLMLHVSHEDGFLALRPKRQPRALSDLAAAAARSLDQARAPLTDRERLRRRPDSLTVRQRRNLELWGYPYVFSDFRFHMTLTDRVAGAEASRLAEAAAGYAEDLLARPLSINAVTVVEQLRADGPFRPVAHLQLAGSPKNQTSRATAKSEAEPPGAVGRMTTRRGS